MKTAAEYQFGKYQYFVSDRMRKSPVTSKIINKIFGITTIGAYGRQLIFRRLISYVPMDKLNRILDLGCGQGEFSFMIADAHKKATVDAIDLDEHAINKIEETVNHFKIENLKALNCRVQDLDRKEYYDLIFSVDVFEHILEEEMPFSACYERLKEGGYLIIKMPNKNNRGIAPDSWFKDFNEWKDIEHVGQVYDLPDLVARFEKEKFRVIASFYSDGILARAGWELNYFMRKGGHIPHLISLPISKMMMKIDKLFVNKKRGNYIQVVGQKI